jgi:uncharacterized lipoprotein YmbA
MMKVNLNRTVTATALLAVMCLTACAGKSPPVDFYTLSVSAPPAGLSGAGSSCSDTVIAIGPVNWPRYLDQPRIVTRTGPNRLDFDEFHRWAGSLQDGFDRVLKKNLSELLQSRLLVSNRQATRIKPEYRVGLDIEQFDGQLGGDVILDVRWAITVDESGKPDTVHVSTIRETTTGPDYEALVRASSLATGRLGQEIAAELVKVCATRTD